MRLFDEAKQLFEELAATQDFLTKARPKAKVLRQGDYTFDGTR